MTTAIADASALVSLGVVAQSEPDPLSLFLTSYDVLLPPEILAELEETASYDDEHGQAATIVLDRRDVFTVQEVDLDTTFPLDDGENAAVTLANESDASLFLCDEFNQLGLIHASLVNSRLVTTPTLLSVFVQTERLAAGDALALLDDISEVRSWNDNSYVKRARSLFEQC